MRWEGRDSFSGERWCREADSAALCKGEGQPGDRGWNPSEQRREVEDAVNDDVERRSLLGGQGGSDVDTCWIRQLGASWSSSPEQIYSCGGCKGQTADGRRGTNQTQQRRRTEQGLAGL